MSLLRARRVSVPSRVINGLDLHGGDGGGSPSRRPPRRRHTSGPARLQLQQHVFDDARGTGLLINVPAESGRVVARMTRPQVSRNAVQTMVYQHMAFKRKT